jgi:hypothetical protein
MLLATNEGRTLDCATVGAEATFGPAQAFKVLAGLGFIGENRICKVAHRGNSYKLMELI